MMRNFQMEEALNAGNEDARIFEARFNPENQYKVRTDFYGEEQTFVCFKLDGLYYTEPKKFIAEQFVKSVEKIKT